MIDFSAISRYGEIDNYQSSLFDLLGVKYALTIKRDEISVPSPKGKPGYKFNYKKFNQVFDSGSVAVLENQAAFERAFLVRKIEVSASEEETGKKMATISADLRGTAFLERRL